MSTAQESDEKRQDELTPPGQDEIPEEWLQSYARAYKKIIEWEKERQKRENTHHQNQANEQADND